MLDKKEVERQRLAALPKKIEKKETHEDFILKLRESHLKEYMDDLVKSVEWLLRDVKRSQEQLNDKKYITKYGAEDPVREALNRATYFNANVLIGADAIAKYAEARVRKELAK